MSFIDEFQADLEALPNILQKRYALMRDLDKSLQEIVRQNEQRCEQEIEDIKRGVRAENIRFSDEALDEQKHGIRIADEKVALAIQTYDLKERMQLPHHLFQVLIVPLNLEGPMKVEEEGVKIIAI